VTATVDPDRADVVDADVISLTIPSAMRFVRLVRIAVASIGRRNGLSVRAIDDLRLAVDEAFSLLLRDSDHRGSIDVTFEVDAHELLVSIVQRLDDGPVESHEDDLVRFDVVISDLVDRFEADAKVGVVQFSKRLS
jgi:serine/threonine-protein kinase RsbW